MQATRRPARTPFAQQPHIPPPLCLQAIRPIRAGEEIYVHYGDDYWKARGVDPATGDAAPPEGEVAESLQLLEKLRERARKQPSKVKAAKRGLGTW